MQKATENKMNLTNTNQWSNIPIVLANTSTEIGISNSTGVISTPIRKCFFYVRYMVDCLKHLSRWRFPVDRNANFIQSITILIGIGSDGLKTKLLETIMSKNSNKGSIRPKQAAELTQLPFYDANYAPACFWRVNPSDDYIQDCKLGQDYATAALDFILEHNFTPLLGWIVKDMIILDNYAGIEAGFFSKISETAIKQHKHDYTLAKVKGEGL